MGLESDTQVGIDNISFNIKTTYYPTLQCEFNNSTYFLHSQDS